MSIDVNRHMNGTELVTVDLSDIPKLPTDLYLPQCPSIYEESFLVIYQLILRRNKLTSLVPYINAIKKIQKNLMHLSLRGNDFSSFPIEATILPNLTSLSLAENKLTHIDDGILPRLFNLQWLNLSKNYFESLPTDIFKCLQLRGLDISCNKLPEFPETILSLPNLKTLLLDKNRISNIPTHFKFPKTLEILSLASNLLTEIPSSLIYQPPENLAHLNISGSFIEELPFDFLSIGYKNLTSLDIHSCQLKSCPAWFFIRLSEINKLRRVNMALNHLEEIPSEIGTITQLQWLNFNGNMLKSLPASISALNQLVKFGIAQNKLEKLPPLLFIHMQKLEKLDIRKNQLRYLPPSILSLMKIPSRLINVEIFVPHQVFSSFDLRSTCERHVKFSTYYDTLFGKRVCENCHPFGGELDDLFLAGNLKLQYVTGILCEPYDGDSFEPIQILSLYTAFELLEALPGGSSQTTMKQALNDAIFLEKKDGKPALGLKNMVYCHSQKFSRNFFSDTDQVDLDDEIIEDNVLLKTKVRGALTDTPSLQEIALCTRLNSTENQFYAHRNKKYHEFFKKECRFDHSPERKRSFITKVLSYPCIPTFIRQAAIDAVHQCDACLKWYTYSNVKIGYISKVPDSGLSIPIRYQMCSFNCALNTLVNMFIKTQKCQSRCGNPQIE